MIAKQQKEIKKNHSESKNEQNDCETIKNNYLEFKNKRNEFEIINANKKLSFRI
jgi:hypothetical protein